VLRSAKAAEQKPFSDSAKQKL